MDFVITDGKRYISTKGGIKSVASIKSATKMTKEKAENVLKAIPNTLKMFDWECVSLATLQSKKKLTSQPITRPLEEYEGLTDNILEKMMDWEHYIIKLQEYMTTINDQLSLVDKEISDIRHYATEFDLNMYQGWKLYKMLQDAGRRRKKIKYERIKIDYILNSNFVDCTNKAISNYIKRLDSTEYKPRVLKELFNV